jgi:hypothetical protein
MADSEKLCRSFALGLAEVPNATLQEAQALLTPENLAAMSSLTGIWLASQGVPVVGEAVDAALATLGIILLTAQVSDLSNALWQYTRIATTAQRQDDLKAASVHLARAIALVGVNIVTFILTTKVSSRARRQPPPREPTLQPTTQSGTPLAETSRRMGEAGGHPDAVAANQTRPPTVGSGAVAEGTTVSSTSRVFAVNAIVKRINPVTFKRWLEGAPRKPVVGNDPARKFQRAHAGEEEILVKGGDVQIWADGARSSDAHLVEAKHVRAADTSPFIDGSKCDDAVRVMIREQVRKEFERYAAILRDPETPAVGLEVIVNDVRALAFFQTLMRQSGIPGRIRVIHEGQTP